MGDISPLQAWKQIMAILCITGQYYEEIKEFNKLASVLQLQESNSDNIFYSLRKEI